MVWGKQKSTTAAGRQTNIPQHGLVVTRAADLVPQKLSRVWNGRFVLGKIGFIAGEPGLGKSLIAAYMTATVSTGGKWWGDEGKARRGDVIYISAEDGAADTIRPRLEAVSASLDRVHVISESITEPGSRPFTLPTPIRGKPDEALPGKVLGSPCCRNHPPHQRAPEPTDFIASIRQVSDKYWRCSVASKRWPPSIGPLSSRSSFHQDEGSERAVADHGSFRLRCSGTSASTLKVELDDPTERTSCHAKTPSVQTGCSCISNRGTARRRQNCPSLTLCSPEDNFDRNPIVGMVPKANNKARQAPRRHASSRYAARGSPACQCTSVEDGNRACAEWLTMASIPANTRATPNGVQTCTDHPETHQAHEGRNGPAPSLGIATGRPRGISRARYRRQGWQGELGGVANKHGRLPKTVMSKTGKGLVTSKISPPTALGVGNFAGRLGKEIDVRGTRLTPSAAAAAIHVALVATHMSMAGERRPSRQPPPEGPIDLVWCGPKSTDRCRDQNGARTSELPRPTSIVPRTARTRRARVSYAGSEKHPPTSGTTHPIWRRPSSAIRAVQTLVEIGHVAANWRGWLARSISTTMQLVRLSRADYRPGVSTPGGCRS